MICMQNINQSMLLVKKYSDGRVSVSIRSAKRGNAYKIAQN